LSDLGREESDAELFATIVAGSAEAARAAQRALYRRHLRYLYGVVHRRREKLVQLAGLSVDDLVQDTFQRAFQRAASFRAEPELDPDRQRRRARAWLGRIAQNLLVDAFRRNREVSATPYLERVSATAPEEAPPSDPQLSVLRAAMATLSEREQDVLRVTALYQKADGHNRLPNDVSAELSARWGISNDNLRAIRSRAMKKLRHAMEQGS